MLTTTNVEKNILYWNIGKVILEYSTWGNKFVENLSKDLRMKYPGTQGYSVRNLNYMKQFASRIPTEEILHRVGAKINWRTIKALIDKAESIEEYVWYAEQCLENGWSSTVLVHQIESGLYQRQALAVKTTNFQTQLLAPLGEQAEEIIKDPYVFDFLPNAKQMKEVELENALVQQVTSLLLEFGSGFAFMGHQFPIRVLYDWLREKKPRPYGSFGNGSAMRVSAAGRLAYHSKKHTALLRLTRKNKSHITTNAQNV